MCVIIYVNGGHTSGVGAVVGVGVGVGVFVSPAQIYHDLPIFVHFFVMFGDLFELICTICMLSYA